MWITCSSSKRLSAKSRHGFHRLLMLIVSYCYFEVWHHSTSREEAGDRIAKYNGLMAEFFANYSMLVINSFGLQNAMQRFPIDIPHFFVRVHSSAKTCAIIVKELGPLEFLKYAPDSHFVFTSYAVLSLLKVSFRNSTSQLGLTRKSVASPRISSIARSRTRDTSVGQRGRGDF